MHSYFKWFWAKTPIRSSKRLGQQTMMGWTSCWTLFESGLRAFSEESCSRPENNNGVPFETDNLIEVVENNFNLTMNELDQKIFEKLDDFKGDQKILDDTAVMSCKFYM